MLFAKRRTSRFSHDTSSGGNSYHAPAPLISSPELAPLILLGVDQLLRKLGQGFGKDDVITTKKIKRAGTPLKEVLQTQRQILRFTTMQSRKGEGRDCNVVMLKRQLSI